MVYQRGDVVLVPFPFRDRAETRVRPAVVVSGVQYQRELPDLIVAAITTHSPRVATDYALADWKAANLVSASVVRMQLATIAEDRVRFSPGRLSERDLQEVVPRLRTLARRLRRGTPHETPHAGTGKGLA